MEYQLRYIIMNTISDVNKKMIKSELHKLLGARRMHITDLQRKTGLSYKTLHDLYHERTSRIDFNTIDLICRALDVEPGDLLKYQLTKEGGE